MYPVVVESTSEYLGKQDSCVEEVLHVPSYLLRQLNVDLLRGLVHVATLNVLAVLLSIVPTKDEYILYLYVRQKNIENFFVPHENPSVQDA